MEPTPPLKPPVSSAPPRPAGPPPSAMAPQRQADPASAPNIRNPFLTKPPAATAASVAQQQQAASVRNMPQNPQQNLNQPPQQQIQAQQQMHAMQAAGQVPQPAMASVVPVVDDDASSATARLPLGQRLLSKGLISADQLETALREQRTQGAHKKMLGAILVEMGFITESALGEVLAESSGVKSFELRKAVLDPKLIKKIPKEVALRCKAVPVNIDRDTVSIAITDVYNILAIDQIRRYFPANYKIVPVYSVEAEILEVIDQYYGYEMSIEGILREIETGISENNTLSGEIEGYVNPTVRLVDALLIDAVKRGASDIHLEPEGAFLRVRYRVDGKMLQTRSLHKEYWPAIVVRLKIMAGMNIAENRHPQDGRISYNVFGREVDMRVATHPTVHGENIVMRILDKHQSLLPLERLGFHEHNERTLKRLLKRPEGMFIITGPTGSGKTTTLYSILNYINSPDRNIMTLENPVEYQMPLIRQSDIREETGMDFITGIKSLLRQDPDVIFIGEIRDEATANMAMRAAMTGHQVYTTLHTNDALGAIPRLIDTGIPPHLLAGSLICTMAQRLIRKLCKYCKRPNLATIEECRILDVNTDNPPVIYHHFGCHRCSGTGYKSRIAVTEILVVDKGMDELIATGATRRMMLEYALSKGFVPMIQDGIGKVLEGMTDLEELIRTVDLTERL